jgi:hypothetical protein
MHAVVRQYSSTTDLRDIIREKHQSLEEAMKSLPGFVAYHLISDGTSVVTVTICNDQAGADASMQKAADWVKQNLPADSGLGAPQVTRGEVMADARK